MKVLNSSKKNSQFNSQTIGFNLEYFFYRRKVRLAVSIELTIFCRVINCFKFLVTEN